MIVLFEDKDYPRFSPLIEYRPTFFLKVGALSLWEYLKETFPLQKIVGFSSRKLINEKYHFLPEKGFKSNQKIIFLNGSLLPSFENIQLIKKLILYKSEVVFFTQKKLLALKSHLPLPYLTLSVINQTAKKIKKKRNAFRENPFSFLDNIFSISVYQSNLLLEHLSLKKKKSKLLKKNILVEEKITLPSNVSFDVSQGPIYLAPEVRIEPFSFLKGPLWIDTRAVVKSHSRIEASFIGREVRIAGEIIHCLIYEFSNKAHHGFLGHSLVGSWVNIGAGTTTSNLKNTYGEIKVELSNEEKINSSLIFLGTIIGDFAKVAINTSIFAGKLIGFGASVIGVVDRNISLGEFLTSKKKKNKKKLFWKKDSFFKMAQKIFLRRNQNFEDTCDSNRKIINKLFKPLPPS